MELWHNPRCSKSREAKALLQEREVTFRERNYLEEPPTAEELDAVLRALGREPWELARLREPISLQLGLAGWPHDRDRWIGTMVDHPILIERPILIADDGRAVLGRPPEDVLTLLD